jgi:hypothetical protein
MVGGVQSMIDDKKKLWFMIATNFKTTKPEMAEKMAEEIISKIKTKEEYEFVNRLVQGGKDG